jgi:DNA repair photolyase
LNSPKTILTNEEALKLRPFVGDMPRIAVASEHTDPVFFSKKIIKILNGEESVQDKYHPNAYTGKDFNALYLITKHDGLPLKELLEQPIPKIIHFSITGLGGTKWEPGVMKPDDLLDRIADFIKQGLDPEMVTVRIDPIVPGVTSTQMIENIVKRASEMGIKKIRYSVMDRYKTTSKYVEAIGYDYSKYYPQGGLHATQEVRDKIDSFMVSMKEKYGVELFTCAEPNSKYADKISKEACLSVAAVNNMLGTSIPETATGSQRQLCSCFGGKTDLLRYDNKCSSSCVYCYAHHNLDKNLNYYNEDGTLKDNPFTRTSKPEESSAPSTPIANPSEFTNHSGGARGSDYYGWDEIGREFGVINHRHYYTGEKSDLNSPFGNVEITSTDYEEGRYKVAQAAKRNYGYQYKAMKDSRLIRNWAQVKYADAIFAIGTIAQTGEKLFPNKPGDTRVATAPSVTGGTGYAVGMAINEGKPVHVFDQTKKAWFVWDGKQFV